MSNDFEKVRKYYQAFYEKYDQLPVELRLKLMDYIIMPKIADINEILEDKEIEDLLGGIF